MSTHRCPRCEQQIEIEDLICSACGQIDSGAADFAVPGQHGGASRFGATATVWMVIAIVCLALSGIAVVAPSFPPPVALQAEEAEDSAFVQPQQRGVSGGGGGGKSSGRRSSIYCPYYPPGYIPPYEDAGRYAECTGRN